MIPDLVTLLASVGDGATPADYAAAVIERNVLGKPSLGARRDTLGHLRNRYALDSTVPLFSGLREIWPGDVAAQPLLAMLLAAARDPVLRLGAEVVAATPTGAAVTWHTFETPIREAFVDYGSEKSVRIIAERQPASWMQSGHLRQDTPSRRVRSRPTSRPATIAYALWLGHLTGLGGDALFTSPWVRMLDASPEVIDDLAREAGRQGLIDLRRGGGVTSVGFRWLDGKTSLTPEGDRS